MGNPREAHQGDAGRVRRTESVLLRHAMPDGSVHLDWMIERPEPAAGLISFRIDPGVELSKPGSLRAERIADHRRDYLAYEGPVSGGRGRVERIARFGVISLIEAESSLSVILQEEGGGCRMEWTGERANGPHWIFAGVVC